MAYLFCLEVCILNSFCLEKIMNINDEEEKGEMFSHLDFSLLGTC